MLAFVPPAEPQGRTSRQLKEGLPLGHVKAPYACQYEVRVVLGSDQCRAPAKALRAETSRW